MNKLLTKIIGVALGLGLATGVGAGVIAGNKNIVPAHADDTFSHSYTYSEKGSTWSLTNCEDKSSYWLVPSTTTNDSVALIEDVFDGKTITSDVTITLDIACFGNGSNPTSSKFSFYNDENCTSSVASTQSGSLPSSSTYTSAVYTI